MGLVSLHRRWHFSARCVTNGAIVVVLPYATTQSNPTCHLLRGQVSAVQLEYYPTLLLGAAEFSSTSPGVGHLSAKGKTLCELLHHAYHKVSHHQTQSHSRQQMGCRNSGLPRSFPFRVTDDDILPDDDKEDVLADEGDF